MWKPSLAKLVLAVVLETINHPTSLKILASTTRGKPDGIEADIQASCITDVPAVAEDGMFKAGSVRARLAQISLVLPIPGPPKPSAPASLPKPSAPTSLPKPSAPTSLPKPSAFLPRPARLRACPAIAHTNKDGCAMKGVILMPRPVHPSLPPRVARLPGDCARQSRRMCYEKRNSNVLAGGSHKPTGII